MCAYLMNKTESPALSRFAPTNKLHPVVRRCRFGWPEVKEQDRLLPITHNQGNGRFKKPVSLYKGKASINNSKQ